MARKLPLLAVLLALLASAAPARAAQDPFYGVWFDGLSPAPETAALELDRIAATGAGEIRQHIWWDRIETSPGFFDWQRLDRLIGDAADRGLRILPVLLHTPAFYSSKPPGSASSAQFPPSDMWTMARFADKMVRRYGPNGTFWCQGGTCRAPYLPVRAWQVWNEPDYPAWWKGHPKPLEYSEMLRAVSSMIRVADPTAEIVLGGLTWPGATEPNGYLATLYVQGAAAFFDSMAFHPYGKHVAGTVDMVRRARQVMTSHLDGSTPIRITEYGWASGGTSANVSTTLACQAALLYSATRRLKSLREELNVTAVDQFMWNDRPAVPRPIWPFFAGMVNIDGSAKPALGAFTEAIALRPPPAGLSVREACPPDRWNIS